MNPAVHPPDDRWLDLVNGLLPAEQRAAALDHARTCGRCRDRMRSFAATHERTAARRIPRARANRGPMLALAATVVAVSGIALWATLRPGLDTLPVVPAPLPSPDPRIVTRALEPGPEDSAVTEGLAAYRSGDLARARQLLAAAHATGSSEQVRLLYLGNARLQLGDPRGAIRDLRRVNPSLVPEPWLGEWQWSLAVALATAGDRATAESLRVVLSERPDSIGARARARQFEPSGPR